MDIIYQTNQLFWNKSLYLILYAICLVVLLVGKKHFKKGRRVLFGYSVLTYVVLICNPIFVKVAFKGFFTLKEEYVRMFWLLPIWITLAYTFTQLVYRLKNKYAQILMAVGIIIILIVMGTTYSAQGMYKTPENIYKISQDALNISDMILEDSGGEADVVITKMSNVWDELYWGIRQYTSKIRMKEEIITEEDYQREYKEVFDIYWDQIEENTQFKYVICERTGELCRRIEQRGYYEVGSSGNYVVYKK